MDSFCGYIGMIVKYLMILVMVCTRKHEVISGSEALIIKEKKKRNQLFVSFR